MLIKIGVCKIRSVVRPVQNIICSCATELKAAFISMFRGRRMDLYICKFKQTHAYIDVQVRIMSNYQVMVEEGVDEYLEGEWLQ